MLVVDLKSKMENRKYCVTCRLPLIAFEGCYLHPDKPCNGIKDTINIEAVVDDDFLQNKFIGLYGKPSIDDYERVGLLEDNVVTLQEKNKAIEKQNEEHVSNIRKLIPLIDFPLVKFFLWVFRKL